MNIIKALVFALFTILTSCFNKTDQASQNLQANTIKHEKNNDFIKNKKCQIPAQIVAYFKENESSYQLVNNDNFPMVNQYKDCPYLTIGDFNGNGKSDVAIIVLDKHYRADGYGNYQFPFLLIFNDYENTASPKPFVIVKSDKYKQDPIQTVIYNQFEDGIFSYINKAIQCNKEVVEITIPEKSTFYVLWNDSKQNYDYFHSTELNCKNNVEEVEDENSIYSLSHDWDFDGINDKIIIYKNEAGNDAFEKEHFGLSLKIFKGQKEGSYALWSENNEIIFKNQNSCVSEGFNTIVAKSNYFTIEQQDCFDYNILVNSYTTFKMVGNEIYLHKYGETYFDKANHDRKIPEKIWTTKDFGTIKFEDVTENILINLRQTDPKK